LDILNLYFLNDIAEKEMRRKCGFNEVARDIYKIISWKQYILYHYSCDFKGFSVEECYHKLNFLILPILVFLQTISHTKNFIF